MGLRDQNNRIQFAELFEIGAFLDCFLSDCLRVRAGYSAFWAVHVADAVHQVDFNLAETGKYVGNSSVFYHGPSVSLTIRY